MPYPHLINQVIDVAHPDFVDFPASINGEIYMDGDANMGWITRPNFTPAEQAAHDAAMQELADDTADMDAIKTDAQVRQLITARPQWIENYIDNNVTNLESAKDVLKILVKAISAIGKRQFR